MRPPSEAHSLLIRVMRGCPWNYCTFCGAYKGLSRKDTLRTVDEVTGDIETVRTASDQLRLLGRWADPRTAFLGDSNALLTKTDGLVEILTYLHDAFPSLQRVTSYGRAKTVLVKKPHELQRLREAGLTRLHLGLESGDAEVLSRVRKGATPDEMIEAGRKAKDSGFELSEYVMPGLGGRARSQQHARESARVLSAIDPHFVRVRPLMVMAGTPLHDEYRAGHFELLSIGELLTELRTLVESLDITSRLCFDHYANPPMFRQDWNGYKFPQEKGEVLDLIAGALESVKEHGRGDRLYQPPPESVVRL